MGEPQFVASLHRVIYGYVTVRYSISTLFGKTLTYQRTAFTQFTCVSKIYGYIEYVGIEL